jgi:hypothetical protein
MRAARATNLGPILRLRAYPGSSTVTIGGQPDPLAFLGIDDVVVDGSQAHYNVYLDAEARFARRHRDGEERSNVGHGGVSGS